MRPCAFLVIAALALSACGQQPQSTAITPDLLESPEKIAAIENRLEPAERDVFGRYVFQRSMRSQTGASSLVMPDGKDPATVADAIRLQQAYEKVEKERALALAAASAKMDAAAVGDTAAYNAGVAEYNAALKSYEAKLANPLAKPTA